MMPATRRRAAAKRAAGNEDAGDKKAAPRTANVAARKRKAPVDSKDQVKNAKKSKEESTENKTKKKQAEKKKNDGKKGRKESSSNEKTQKTETEIKQEPESDMIIDEKENGVVEGHDSKYFKVKTEESPLTVKTENSDVEEIISDDSDSDFEEVPADNRKDIMTNFDISENATESKAQNGSVKKNSEKRARKKASPQKVKSPKKVSLDGASPMDLLLQLEDVKPKEEAKEEKGEEGKKKGKKVANKKKRNEKEEKRNEEEMSESESDSDWENVADVSLMKDIKDQVPEEAVQITLQEPSLMYKKRKRKKFDLEDWFQKQVNKYHRSTHLEMHKVHLLCLLSYGFQRNLTCSDETLLALSLSQVPLKDLGQPAKKWDSSFLTKFTKWFSKYYGIDAETQGKTPGLENTLVERFESRKVSSEEELAYLFVLTIRSLGGEVRLVISLQPVSHKPNLKNFLIKRRKRNEEGNEDEKEETSPKADSPTDGAVASSSNSKSSEKEEEPKKEKISSSQNEKTVGKAKDRKKESSKTSKTTKTSKKSDGIKKSEGKSKSVKKTLEEEEEGKKERRRTGRRSSSGKKTYKETGSGSEESEDEFEPNLSESSSEDEKDAEAKKGKGKSKKKVAAKKAKEVIELSSGSDFEEMNTSFRSPPERKRKPRNKKILSSESEDSVQLVGEKIKSKGNDYWAEVYLEKEKKWMCVDCLRAEINKPHDLEGRATKPVSYILAFDNGNHVKDVTRRYASSFTSTRKNRPDADWWEETLEPFGGPQRDEQEDMQLKVELLQKPLPTAVGEYKNHPLYALKRHLLKFEAIYPESSVPVGYIRGEAVFARECVHLLHTRENWLKEARVVRIGETAYKLVKGRKKRRQALAGGDVEPVAELFGRWQTEDYIPPPAVDGKVPKNEYGNIEMFKPSMLPGGTVHLKGLNGLNRIARKLNLDVAAAMVGWDHHCGFAHPVLDGWVVCEEHKDILLAAWDEEQEIIKEREALKREKRIYGNWKLLIKGVLIREKLKSRFNLEPAKDDPEANQPSTSGGKKAGDMEISWPLNRQKEKPKGKGRKKKEEGPLFPFEEI